MSGFTLDWVIESDIYDWREAATDTCLLSMRLNLCCKNKRPLFSLFPIISSLVPIHL